MTSILDRLRRKKQPAGPLAADGQLASDLWVDQPDAEQRIERWRAKGEVGEAEAAALTQFVRRGYLTFSSGLPDEVFAAFADDVERAWRERPGDLAWTREGPLRSFAYADAARDRRPSYRIADLYSHSDAARTIYLWKPIFALVERIFGQPAVATQSLYFEFGSQQALHRDPVFVQTRPASHLVAAWVALEDIVAESGPLVYVPGSHRLPYHQFAPGDHLFDHSRHGSQESAAMAEFDRRQVAERGLGSETLLCPRGDVLIWHASLLHGGSVPHDPARTRKSFVVHFSTRANYPLRRQTLVELLGDTTRTRIFETDRILSADGCHGFDNPVRGYRPPAAGH